MSIDTKKKTATEKLRLIKSGFVSKTINSAVGANSFNSVKDIDLSGISTDSIFVVVYGHRITDGSDYATIPNQGTLELIDLAYVLLAGYKITGSTLSIGYYNPNAGFTPSTTPYRTVYLSYYLFSY